MLESNIKQLIGELTFQLAVAQTRVLELETQLKEQNESKGTESETLG